jgi:hypothetical protein
MTTYTVGPTPVDDQIRAEMAVAARRREETYRHRVDRLTELLLLAGEDAPGLLADPRALQEAVAVATDRWSKLGDLEGQITRERATLARLEAALEASTAPKPPFSSAQELQSADEYQALVAQVKNARASVEALTSQAKTQRAELEALASR